MQKSAKKLGLALFVMLLCLLVRPMQVNAGNVRTGTLGENNGITWTYDEDTKTLTITGEDSGLQGIYDSATWSYKSPFVAICEDVEVIKVQNCTLKGACTGLFAGLESLRTIEFHTFDTSKVVDMGGMFSGCSSLSSLDVSKFDTSKVTDMSWMFYGCSSLSSLDVSNFDTSKVTSMYGMFYDCSSLSSLDVSNFDTSNGISMDSMFYGCSSLSSLDVSNFDTTNIRYMDSMFEGCSSLSSLDLSNFDTSNGISMDWMFDGCSSLTELDLSGFDLTSAEFWGDMLQNCNSLEIIKTPKKMRDDITIELPGTFVDEQSKATNKITTEFCNKTLYGQRARVSAFTERMYTIVLGRAAEEQGLNDWTNRLMAKEIDGATLVDMFVNSDEFINRNTSDEEYIKILYRAVLGREADEGGLKMWKDMLADDWTRDYILEGLVLSTEFKNICDSYGIIAAFEPTAESQVRSFVKRMYTVVLNRRADAVGLDNWTRQLMNGTVNGAKVADGFINSQEFANRNLSNEKYVKVLYRAFFNREPDEGGFNVWMSELAKGTSRREVMKGFVHSVEFSDLCAAYGIIRGEIQ